jgi:hypothetical protein
MGKTSSAVKNKYNSKAYDDLRVVVPKGRKADIQARLEAKGGGTINRLVNGLLMAWYGMTASEWGYKDKVVKDDEMSNG